MQEEYNQSNDVSGSTNDAGTQGPVQNVDPLPETQPVREDNGSHTGRKIVVSLLVVFGMLLLFIANLAFWARFTMLNTNGWVNAVGPLTKDPQIAQVIGIYVADEIFEVTDIDQAVTEMLPADFQLLSAPLSTAMEHLVEEAVTAFVQSNLANAVWVNTNRVAHNLIVSVLRGEGDVAYLEKGELVVDASPVVDLVKNTFGLEELGIELADDAGRIVLLENQQVAYLQQAVSYLDTIGILLPVITLVVLIIAVLVSLWRRNTLLWIGVGIIITMVISLIAYEVSESWFLVSISDPLLRLIGGGIWNAVINGLITQTIVLIVLGVLLVIGAWVAGPSRSAVSIRTTVQGWTGR